MQNNLIKVLFIGDVVGKPGRSILKKHLKDLKESLSSDFIIANIENLAGGFGITENTFKELEGLGLIDCYVSGNHIWDKKEAEQLIENFPVILRPANYPDGVPGKGFMVLEKNGKKLAVVNLLGRTLMKDCVDCPFRTAENIVTKLKSITDNIFIDFHAEATSEKEALGYFLNGTVSVVAGTHTHVQTADNRILNEGTAYISDVGMTGDIDSVIGFSPAEVIEKFLTQMPKRFKIKKTGKREIQGIFVTISANNGKSLTIERIKYKED